MTTRTPLPITVVGGYLGAGKTTLVNHLLREAGHRRLAVLVNDFGELPIDADLIENVSGSVVGIAGGCVCCSYGSDLVAALEGLAALAPRPDQVLVETSGVALPGAVASAIALLPDYVLDGVLVLADAETLQRRAADPYMGDTVLRQLAEADLVVLNKIDLVQPDDLVVLRRWLADTAPGKPVVDAREARIPPALAFGLDRVAPDGATCAVAPTRDTPHTAAFATASLEIVHAVDAEALARRLAGADPELLRAKGIVRDACGTTLQLQVVGSRWQVARAAVALAGPGRLVAIARAGDVASETLAALVDASRVTL